MGLACELIQIQKCWFFGPPFAHLLTGHALDMWTLSYVSPLSLTQVRTKVDRPSPVVSADLKRNSYLKIRILRIFRLSTSMVPGTLYNEPLHAVVGGELGQGQQVLHGDRLVDLGHLHFHLYFCYFLHPSALARFPFSTRTSWYSSKN